LIREKSGEKPFFLDQKVDHCRLSTMATQHAVQIYGGASRNATRNIWGCSLARK
jgi:hypothetical protein